VQEFAQATKLEFSQLPQQPIMLYYVLQLLVLHTRAASHKSSACHHDFVDDEVAALQLSSSLGRDLDLYDRDLDKEPPRTGKDARFDLPLDLSGKWCKKGSDDVIVNAYIWHECLELTFVSEKNSPNGTKFSGPLHHAQADGNFVTVDDTLTTGRHAVEYISYKSIIAAPTKAEADDGATAVLVFYSDSSVPDLIQPDGSVTTYTYDTELAIRYIDSKGRLVFQQNKTALPASTPLERMEKFGYLPCVYPHESPASEYCATRTQSKPDVYDSFTPACCGDGYNGSTEVYTDKADPRWAEYVADCDAEPMFRVS